MNLDQRARPTLKERLEFVVQAPCDWILKASCVRYASFLAMFRLLPPSYLAWASRVKARKAYYRPRHGAANSFHAEGSARTRKRTRTTI
jgi:hypothetical protein